MTTKNHEFFHEEERVSIVPWPLPTINEGSLRRDPASGTTVLAGSEWPLGKMEIQAESIGLVRSQQNGVR
jgi:hypothetical protein